MQIDKIQLLNQLDRDLGQQIDIVRRRFIPLKPGELNRPSTTGGWSILQCLDHLNSYGRYYIPELVQALRKAGPSDRAVYNSGWLGDYFTRMMSPESKQKYKAFKGHIPPAQLDPAAVLDEFLRQSQQLSEIIGSSKAIDPGSVRVPISIARFITLKLGDTIRFIIAHNSRHMQQALRNLS